MDNYQVQVPNQIYKQLREIRQYISHSLSNPSAGEKLVRELIRGLRSLEIFPERGFNADERFGKALTPGHVTRGLPLKKGYIVLYDVDTDEKIVQVRYLLSTKSDYFKLFK
ncbi:MULTISPECIES: type II toxin-antitoxin system RelE/ParE family toxin [unclassified Streptococcus]|uniref:type II toxin-antitoxin system RelE/ParE family toxin n=1 Tax=unclassified Streptococcus TaxID=2608887 RepID=UPI00359D9FA2